MVERETPAPGILLKTQFRALEPVGNPLLQVDAHVTFDDGYVGVSRLFQSQAQAGAASSKTLNVDAEADVFRLAFQAPGDFGGGLRGNRDHSATPPRYIPYPVGLW